MAISMNYICSVLFLMLVSVDRYLILVKPMSPNRLTRAAWAKRICLGIWSMGFLFKLPILLFRTVLYIEDPSVNACILAYLHPFWRLHHNITRNVLGFQIPVLVVAYYTRHIVTALNDRGTSTPSRVRVERKATYLVLAALAVFLFCWTLHQVMRFLDTLDYFQVTPGCLWGHILDIAIQLSTCVAYSNSAVNPFLFVIVGKHFRRRAKEMCGKNMNHGSKGMPYLTVSITSMNRLNDTQHINIEKLETSGHDL